MMNPEAPAAPINNGGTILTGGVIADVIPTATTDVVTDPATKPPRAPRASRFPRIGRPGRPFTVNEAEVAGVMDDAQADLDALNDLDGIISTIELETADETAVDTVPGGTMAATNTATSAEAAKFRDGVQTLGVFVKTVRQDADAGVDAVRASLKPEIARAAAIEKELRALADAHLQDVQALESWLLDDVGVAKLRAASGRGELERLHELIIAVLRKLQKTPAALGEIPVRVASITAEEADPAVRPSQRTIKRIREDVEQAEFLPQSVRENILEMSALLDSLNARAARASLTDVRVLNIIGAEELTRHERDAQQRRGTWRAPDWHPLGSLDG